jgi:hypothetical protein
MPLKHNHNGMTSQLDLFIVDVCRQYEYRGVRSKKKFFVVFNLCLTCAVFFHKVSVVSIQNVPMCGVSLHGGRCTVSIINGKCGKYWQGT